MTATRVPTAEIAVYGKGGIGKSTISANISAALALAGRQVLQIGCDPKHDSTRLLVHGQKPPTVLDYLRETNPPEYRLEDILLTGFCGIGCVEAGGPKPGVGCAGRGIISTFELLAQFNLKQRYNAVVYDVLGDVVCGGFAVPIRREYADTIFVVTSGEFMALYAANNILRGIRNFDEDHCRVAGLIYNQRNVAGEDERVERFAQAVGLPICARVPRSDSFTYAEQAEMTVVEQGDDATLTALFAGLAAEINAGCLRYQARPLSDEDLEKVVLGEQVAARHASQNTADAAGLRAASLLPDAPLPGAPLSRESVVAPSPAALASSPQLQQSNDSVAEQPAHRYLSKNLLRGEPLHGCAFNGAMAISAQIRDATILAHSPKSCAYLSYQVISAPGRRAMFERGSLLPASLIPNLECTEMGESEMIFGGMEQLEAKVSELKNRSAPQPRAIVVVSACPAGIIGDDIDRLRERSTSDIPLVTLRTDGNMTGDYLQGMLMAYTSLAHQIIQPQAAPRPDTVNIVFEKQIATNSEDSFLIVRGFLNQLGLSVNCRFLNNTSFDSLRDFCSAPLSLLGYRDYTGKLLEQFFSEEYGTNFYQHDFPFGVDETEEWLRGLAEFFDRQAVAEQIIAEHRQQYEREIAALKPTLVGKRLMIITYNHELDWVLQAALDVGIEIVKIGVLNYSQDAGFRSQITLPEGKELPVEENYDRSQREPDLQYYQPDILLTNYASSISEEVRVADTIPMCPEVGFYPGVNILKRWARLLRLNQKGGWMSDERLFRQYHSG